MKKQFVAMLTILLLGGVWIQSERLTHMSLRNPGIPEKSRQSPEPAQTDRDSTAATAQTVRSIHQIRRSFLKIVEGVDTADGLQALQAGLQSPDTQLRSAARESVWSLIVDASRGRWPQTTDFEHGLLIELFRAMNSPESRRWMQVHKNPSVMTLNLISEISRGTL